MTRYCFLVLYLLVRFYAGHAQNYHAIQGSYYAGSIGVHNNPASILISPYKWDVTLFGGQLKSASNLLTIYNYSLLSNPANSLYYFTGGHYKRIMDISANLNLLNTRFALNRKSAIAFGLNLKSYTNISTTPYNFYDTLKGSGDFFKINNPGDEYAAKMTSSSWAEIYASYAQTVIDNDAFRLNAGVTLKVNKGLSGAFSRLENMRYVQTRDNRYTLTSNYFEYIYSSNYDDWQKNENNTTNISNFLINTNTALSADAGIEYVLKPRELTGNIEEDNYYDYDWKIGISILDIGFTQYQTGNKSAIASGVKADVTNVTLDNKFDSTVTSLEMFNDSLSTIANDFKTVSYPYKIMNPMRVVVNADHFVGKNIYINAEISINAPSSLFKKKYSVNDMNFITVTPRWETKRFGIYLPIQYTSNNHFWVGGAFKAGPLLIGIHNWANIFTSNSMQNGGAYMALIIRSPKSISKKYDKRLDCPKL